jgi:hypothetical protein
MLERELLREREYKGVLQWLMNRTRAPKFKNVRMMVLRYRFNLRPGPDDDPVFSTTPRTEADRQFMADCQYFHYPAVLEEFRARWTRAALAVTAAQVPVDGEVLLQDGMLTYKGRKLPELSGLGSIHPAAAFALQLRYTYMQLENQGAARFYTDDKDSHTEGFASAINHYYHAYCSVFPDLERHFGSLGSFFDQSSFATPRVYVNPPFDQTLMGEAFTRVQELLAGGATNTFIFTVPDWKDFPELAAAEQSCYRQQVTRYPKGTLLFQNHLTGEKLYPCDIVEVVMAPLAVK